MLSTEEYIKNIAESIDCGQICFLNPDTLELESVMSETNWDDFSDSEELIDSIYQKIEVWERCIQFEPLATFESSKIIEEFVTECIPAGSLQTQLSNTLSARKPFQSFKIIIEASEYCEKWLEYKLTKLIKHVKSILELELIPIIRRDRSAYPVYAKEYSPFR